MFQQDNVRMTGHHLQVADLVVKTAVAGRIKMLQRRERSQVVVVGNDDQEQKVTIGDDGRIKCHPLRQVARMRKPRYRFAGLRAANIAEASWIGPQS